MSDTTLASVPARRRTLFLDEIAALPPTLQSELLRLLENVIRFALLVTPEQELRMEHLRLEGVAAAAATPTRSTGEPVESELRVGSLSQLLASMFQSPGVSLLSDLEQQIVTEAFRFTGRNQVRTAALLGISRNVLRTLLRKHGLLVIRRGSARNRAAKA